MKKINKFLLTIGSLTIPAMPLIGAISCSENLPNKRYTANDMHNTLKNLEDFKSDFPQFADKIINGRVEDFAFQDQHLPQDFYLPKEVREIGIGAFQRAILPESFNFPAYVQSINRWAFDGVSLPSDFELPSSLINIGSGAFENADFGDFIFRPFINQVTIAADAFTGANLRKNESFSLKDFMILRGFGSSLVEGNLATINNWLFPQNVFEISEYMFANVEFSDEFQLPLTVTKINAQAFAGAFLPRDFSIPESVVSIKNNAFAGAHFKGSFALHVPGINNFNPFAYDAFGAGYTYDPFADFSSVDAIDARTLKLLQETSFGQRALDANDQSVHVIDQLRERVVLPTMNDGDKINDYALAGMDLRDYPNLFDPEHALDGLREIGKGAFAGSILPSNFTLPTSIEKIAESAFEHAVFDGDFTVPSNVRDIDQSAFYGASYHGSFVFQPQLANGKLANNMFAFSTLPSGFMIPDDIQVIEENAFYSTIFTPDPSHQSDFDLPTSLEIMGDHVFDSSQIAVPFSNWGHVISLPSYAFAHASLPENFDLNINNSQIHVLKSSVFNNAILNMGFKLPDTLLQLPDSSFQSATLSSDFHLPDTINFIGDNAFSGATLNNNFSLPRDLEIIGQNAFMDATSVNVDQAIPNTLIFEPNNHIKYIGQNAFSNDVFQAGFTLENLDPDVVKMGNNVFEYAQLPDNFALPDLSYIQAGTFSNAILADDFIIPDSVGEIGALAFGQVKIPFINLPDNVIIHDSAFVSAQLPNDFTIPISATVESGAFYLASALANFDEPDLWKMTVNQNQVSGLDINGDPLPGAFVEVAPKVASQYPVFEDNLPVPTSLEVVTTLPAAITVDEVFAYDVSNPMISMTIASDWGGMRGVKASLDPIIFPMQPLGYDFWVQINVIDHSGTQVSVYLHFKPDYFGTLGTANSLAMYERVQIYVGSF